MKILILANKMPYPAKDGGSLATLSLAQGLANSGNKVSILCISTPKHNFPLSNIPETISSQIKIFSVFVDTRFNWVKAAINFLFSKIPYNAARFISKNFKRELSLLLKFEQFDLIQIEGLYMMPYLPIIKQYSKAKISFRAHNVEHEIWQRLILQETNYLKVLLIHHLASRIKKMERSYINQYDMLIPISERDNKIFTQLGNIRPSIAIPFAMDSSFIKMTEITPNSLFFIGSLDWKPNQDGLKWFIENVFTHLRMLFPRLKFQVAGRNASDPFIRFLLTNKVNYLGEIDDATSFISQGGIMVVPLFSGSGMRVKIIEGMAMGKPVITSKIGAEGIPATPGANIIIEENASAWVDAISRILNDPAQGHKIGYQAANFIRRHYDNSLLSQKLLNFYVERTCLLSDADLKILAN
jgi:polysaccharide biosynthesis protein PslH